MALYPPLLGYKPVRAGSPKGLVWGVPGMWAWVLFS